MEAEFLSLPLMVPPTLPHETAVLLGVGMFGASYRVCTRDEVTVVKVLHEPDLDVAAWGRELEILTRLRGPHLRAIARRTRLRHEGRSYACLVMEALEGRSLRESVEAGECPDSAPAWRAFVAGLLHGLRTLHEAGILHRHLTASNVFLRDGDWRHPVITDGGLAKVVQGIAPVHDAAGRTVPATEGEDGPGRLPSLRDDLEQLAVLLWQVRARRGHQTFKSLELGQPTPAVREAIATCATTAMRGDAAAMEALLERVFAVPPRPTRPPRHDEEGQTLAGMA